MLEPDRNIAFSKYPFGSTMAERGKSFGGEYRFGMNTQEKEPELGDGVTSAEFWMYDGKLGRRWNVDPKIITSLSSYCCFANNPNKYSDILGDTLTEKLQIEVNKLKNTAKNNILILEAVKRKLVKSMPEGGSHDNGGNLDVTWVEMKNIDAAITELNEFLFEITEMESAAKFFDIAIDITSKNAETDVKNNTVVITLNSLDNGGMNLLAHELKHGYQYLSGELSYDVVGSATGICSDLTDEVEAYQRQFAFTYLTGDNVNYSEITTELVKKLGGGVYDNYYSSPVNKSTKITKELLEHYFGENPIPEAAIKMIGLPVSDFMNLRGEFYQ